MARTDPSPAMKKPSASSRIREEILREWRGSDEPSNLNAGIHPAGKFVAAILRAAGAEEGLNEDMVRATWKELAGDFIGRHSEPVSVKSGNLLLRCTQPALRFQLEQMKPMLLKRIREKLGEGKVRTIQFAIG